MRRTQWTLALLLAPAVAVAQATGSAQATHRTDASAQVEARHGHVATAGLSAESRARIEAMVAAAQAHGLPTEAMEDRVAEGQAKGASEAQIVAATAKTMGQLRASHEAMVRAGRTEPSDEEVSRGASVIARGATQAQLEAVVEQAPSERSLVVAFEVLTALMARGIPVDNALAVITSNLEARATDAQLAALGASVHGTTTAQTAIGVGLGKGGSETGSSVTGAVKSTLGVGIGLGRKP